MTDDNIEWGEWVGGGLVFPLPDHWQLLCENGTIRHRIGKPSAPVVTEQVLHWVLGSFAGSHRSPGDTHRITITLHDGEPLPVAKVERIK